jgi:hypothetical protein
VYSEVPIVTRYSDVSLPIVRVAALIAGENGIFVAILGVSASARATTAEFDRLCAPGATMKATAAYDFRLSVVITSAPL